MAKAKKQQKKAGKKDAQRSLKEKRAAKAAKRNEKMKPIVVV